MLSKLFGYLRFGITREKIAAVLLIWAILSISPVTWAAGFPDAGVDNVPSLAQFKITFTKEFAFYLKSVKGAPFCEGYTISNCPQSAREYTSPMLYDPNTKIGRSDPHQDGDGTDELWGADVCKEGSTTYCQKFNDMPVVDADFRWEGNYEKDGYPFDEGPTAREEVHTQVLSFKLTPLDSGDYSANAIRAGDQAPCQARNLGEVESLNGVGFPAESFFQMYVDVDLDMDKDGTVDMVLFNQAGGFGSDPLIIESTSLTSFPPKVIYCHTGRSADKDAPKLYVRGNHCQKDAGYTGHVGWLRIATSGIGFGSPSNIRRGTREGVPECLPKYQLTVNKAGTGTGNVTGQDIDCGSNCTKEYVAATNTQVTLTATAEAGSTFTGWNVCSGTEDCTVKMDQDKTVTATFELPTVSSVSPSTATLNELTTFTVKGNYLTADTTFNLEHCNGVTQLSSGSNTQRQFRCTPTGSTGTKSGTVKNKSGGTVLRNFNVIVDAKPVEPTPTTSFPLTVNVVGNGTVTGGINCNGSNCIKNYTKDTPVTLVAKPDTGSTFSGWTGACSGTATTCSFTMTKVESVTATFKTPILTVMTQGNGKVVSTPRGINCGMGGTDCEKSYQTVTLTAFPDTNNDYVFDGWYGIDNCVGTGKCSIDMRIDQTVMAIFKKPNEYSLTVTKDGTGTGLVKVVKGEGINCGSDCTETFATQNTRVTLTAQPLNKSRFVGWDIVGQENADCTGTGTCQVTMNQTQFVIATFDIIVKNQPPVAVLTPTPDTPNGTIVTAPPAWNVKFDASESYDPDGYITEYAWTIDGGQNINREFFNIAFESAGIHAATLKVKDDDDTWSTVRHWNIKLEPPKVRLINISTRAPVRGGKNNAIAGFIITGSGTKKVVILAEGAGLGNRWNGAPVLADSKIVLYQMIDGSFQVIATNDNWQSDSRANEMPDNMQQRLAFSDAGLVMNLAPGTYTAIVQPATGNTTTGIALVSVNDIDDANTSKLINISTLAPIEGSQGNVIAGFIITGTGTQQVVVTARGKSVKLPQERLCQDTTMSVYKMANGKSTEVGNNDDWQEGTQAARIPTHLKPSDPSDASILLNLGAGAYSAIMGCIGGTGIGSISVNVVD